MKKKHILFIAEAATLAHVARPLALSASLDTSRYELSFACATRCHWLLKNFRGQSHALQSMESDYFLAKLMQGQPLYDQAILHRYVRDDLDLLEKTRPDVIVGDFRLSLSVSARVLGIPYLSISNAYWSPYWLPERYPVPNLPITRSLPLPIADTLFRMARPVAFALHARPLNRVRRYYGLPSLGHDLRRIYTDADVVLYADLPDLYPNLSLPSHHYFIGPVLWSPPIASPEWWQQLPHDLPLIYVTLGSSGQAKLLPQVLAALGRLKAVIMVSTAGFTIPDDFVLPTNVYLASYLPGDAAARRASLVICNGGSPTSQQALAAGVPVIGIASNLDQFLNMQSLCAAGIGSVLRADRFNPVDLEKMAQSMLLENGYRSKAQTLGQIMAGYNGGSKFESVIDTVVN